MGLKLFAAATTAAFIFFVAIFNGEVGISQREFPIVLGDMKYDYEALSAPVATGLMLSIQSWVLTQSPFGPFVRRILLNDNKLHYLRELAKQIPYVPPLSFPMRRLSKQQQLFHTQSEERGRLTLSKALNGGVLEDNVSFSDSRVMAYHQAYLKAAGGGESNTPLNVISKTLEALNGPNGLQEKYRIFVSMDQQDLLEQAAESTSRYASGQPLSILDGVPVAVKDMIQVKGHIMKDGSATHEDDKPAEIDDPVVANLRNLGAIVLGTTTMTEGGVTPLGYCAAEKGPFNALDVNFYSGGSSSGSAVAVALGIAPITIGFDGGGSIRIPASFNGAVGLATTFGRLGFELRLATTMIKGGPIAATVDDAAIGYAAMGSAPADHFYGEMYGADGVPPVHLNEYPLVNVDDSKPLAGLRVGVFAEHFNDSDEVVLKACQDTIKRLESLGAEVVPITFPNIGWFRLAHAIKISTEFAMAWDNIYADEVSGPLLEPNTRITAGLGSTVTAKEAMAADKLRRYAFEYMNQLFKDKIDVVASPTLPMLPPKFPKDAIETGESNVPLVVEMMKYIFQANLLGLPALTLPVPPNPATPTHLPIGFQLLGDHWSEAKLLTIAKKLEQSATCPNRSPDYFDALA